MEFWIIQNGEKKGPFFFSELERKLSHGEIVEDTYVWRKGLEEWQPLREIPEYKRIIETAATPEIEPKAIPYKPTQDTARWRRFLARWIDIHAYYVVFFSTLWFFKQDIGSIIQDPLLRLLGYLPLFLLEAICIHYWGTTLGKFTLGLRVETSNGERLSIWQALQRSATAIMLGSGIVFGLMEVCILLHLLHFHLVGKNGKAFWDKPHSFQLTAKPKRFFRVCIALMVFYSCIQVQAAFLFPYLKPLLEQNPQLRELIEPSLQKNPPWSIPPRQ